VTGSAPTYGPSDGLPETTAGPTVVRRRFARFGGSVQVLHRSFDSRRHAGGSPGPGYGSWGFFVFGWRVCCLTLYLCEKGCEGGGLGVAGWQILGPVVIVFLRLYLRAGLCVVWSDLGDGLSGRG